MLLLIKPGMALVWDLVIATIGCLRKSFRDDWDNTLNHKVIPLARLPWDPCNPWQGQLWFVTQEARPDAQWRRDCSAHMCTSSGCGQDMFWWRHFVKGILQSPLGFLKSRSSFCCWPTCCPVLSLLCGCFGVFWRRLPLWGSGKPLTYPCLPSPIVKLIYCQK